MWLLFMSISDQEFKLNSPPFLRSRRILYCYERLFTASRIFLLTRLKKKKKKKTKYYCYRLTIFFFFLRIIKSQVR